MEIWPSGKPRRYLVKAALTSQVSDSDSELAMVSPVQPFFSREGVSVGFWTRLFCSAHSRLRWMRLSRALSVVKVPVRAKPERATCTWNSRESRRGSTARPRAASRLRTSR